MAKRILLIDEERDILDLLKYNLETEGYEIMTATDALRGFELAQTGADLIILETILPNNEKGWELICQLRQMDSTKHIPIISLTTKDYGMDNPCGSECEVNDYIIKPIGIRKLLAQIKELVPVIRS